MYMREVYSITAVLKHYGICILVLFPDCISHGNETDVSHVERKPSLMCLRCTVATSSAVVGAGKMLWISNGMET